MSEEALYTGPARVLAERYGAVFELTLNVPERLNALSLAMADRLSEELSNLDGVRCILLKGSGRAFCSGADLRERAAGAADMGADQRAFVALNDHFHPLIAQLSRLPVPVVSAVNGAAAGIGCALALAADFVVAGQSAYFLAPFSRIGLAADSGLSWTLPRLAGKARASEILLLGEPIPADKAAQWGLIYRQVEDENLLEEARSLAHRLAAGPTTALGLTRMAIAEGLDGLDAGLAREARAQQCAARSVDAVEGAKAFSEKRRPVFLGQ